MRSIKESTPAIDGKRLLSESECRRIDDRVRNYANSYGTTTLNIYSIWSGAVRWARNEVTLASDRRTLMVSVTRAHQHTFAIARTNQIDDVSLEGIVKAAERRMRKVLRPDDIVTKEPDFTAPEPYIWSDATYNAGIELRSGISDFISKKAESQGMLSAGYIEMLGGETVRSDEAGKLTTILSTQGQCSITVRHPRGTGSGWAGLSSYDWAQIDGVSIADKALEKCLASIDPVRIEPGRYTVVMEPQAVADCVRSLFRSFDRSAPERYGSGPYYLGPDYALQLQRSKLGLKVIDERITISHDPMHPQLGTIPHSQQTSRTWIKDGLLVSLDHNRSDILSDLASDELAWTSFGHHMSGGKTSLDEMIEATERGIVVTRLHNVNTFGPRSLISSGVTRDGLWLIEKGKISKAINNLRFTDSPLFMLNQVEELGVPVPVFRPTHTSSTSLTPCVVPPLRARDFAFTALVDAV